MAGRKPKNEPMTKEEMIEAGQQSKGTRIYKAQSKEVTDKAIRQSINNAIEDVKRFDGQAKVKLEDTARVKAIAEAYLESCAVNACFPSMTGLAMALGHTRTNLYIYMQKKQDDETAIFLTQFHDLLADILSENALKGNANNITAIFVLKALYGYKDTQTFELVQGTPFTDTTVDDMVQRAELLD